MEAVRRALLFGRLSTFLVVVTWFLLLFSVIIDVRGSVYWRVVIWLFLSVVSLVFFYVLKPRSVVSNLLVSLMVLSAIFGELFTHFYYTFPLYDKILHFLIPLGITFIAYEVLQKKFSGNVGKCLLYAMLLSLFLSLAWEVVEIIFDYFFDATLVGVFVTQPITDVALASRIEILSPWLDTLYDVILDILGVVTAGFFLYRSHKKEEG